VHIYVYAHTYLHIRTDEHQKNLKTPPKKISKNTSRRQDTHKNRNLAHERERGKERKRERERKRRRKRGQPDNSL